MGARGPLSRHRLLRSTWLQVMRAAWERHQPESGAPRTVVEAALLATCREAVRRGVPFEFFDKHVDELED
jgi:hypothetical protein